MYELLLKIYLHHDDICLFAGVLFPQQTLADLAENIPTYERHIQVSSKLRILILPVLKVK
jgi:hypothetical protein